MEKKPMSPIVAGLLIAVMVIVFSAIMTFSSGAGGSPSGGWISYLIIIAGLIFFINRHGSAINYEASFGQYFSYGFKATTMIVLLWVVFLMILAFSMPEMKQQVVDATRLELEKQKNVTEKEIDTMMEMTNKYFWVILIGTTVFFFVLIGCIGSLIGAAITKKQPKNPFEQTSL